MIHMNHYWDVMLAFHFPSKFSISFSLTSFPFIIRAPSSEFGTYSLCEQRRFRRACASAQSRQNLRCSLIQAASLEEPSDRKPDPWPLWMAGHAQLKFVMTECSKTRIRLTGLIPYVLPLLILMHLRIQCDVWLDNVKNLRQYILRFTVGYPMSLGNVTFHWLTSGSTLLTVLLCCAQQYS